MADLCVGCRKVGHHVVDCPGLGQAHPTTEQTIGREGNSLCQRCTAIDIVGLLSDPDIQDELAPSRAGGSRAGFDNARANDTKRIDLGPLSTLRLISSCPTCRLIFDIFPVPAAVGEANLNAPYHLRPFRGYNRFGNTLVGGGTDEGKKGGDVAARYAVYAAVESREELVGIKSHYMGDEVGSQVHRVQKALALSQANPAPGQPGLAARARGPTVDFGLLKTWLDRCQQHNKQCRVEWSEQLLTSRMVDVAAREVVPCPSDCRYAALSYMWGGVSPEPGALERGTLPRTIEDAITVTKNLGLRYLWVDALCVDQFPSDEQRQQLNMMDVIYNGSWLTIVALDGSNADAGLRGVSTARAPQADETVRGQRILSVFPSIHQEVEFSMYNTRAWTMQEFLLGRRRVLFGKHEAHFLCNTGRYCESVDDSADPGGVLDVHRGPLNDIYFFSNEEDWADGDRPSPETRKKLADEQYCMLIELYTQREMTKEGDSLNAALGVLEHLRKSIISKGFVFGLPLAEYPQALRWYHPRNVKPRRRPGFPSWSFVGWQGMAIYNEALDLVRGGEIVRYDPSVDMSARYVAIRDNVLSVEANRLTLEIRNEPFNDAYVPGTDALVGMLHEGNHLHKNTLPAGVFDFLVVERLSARAAPESRLRHTLYMIMLEGGDRGVASRRTMVRLFVEPGFETQEGYHELVKQREVVDIS